MTRKDQLYYRLSLALVVIGVALILLGIGRELFGFTLFKDSILVGSGLALVGALMAAGFRKKSKAE